MKRKLPQEFIDAQFKNKLNDKEFAHLVDMVKNETDIVRIYEFLDSKFKDNRTKWVNLKRALRLAVDNG